MVTASGPSLAEVLVSRYVDSYRLALSVEGDCWWLTDTSRSEDAYVLIIDVPVLFKRMYGLIAEDWQPPERVVDIAVLRVQMEDEVRLAYEKKFGKAS